jgi:integrase/recombinase XerD
MNAGEQLLSEVTAIIHEMFPSLDVEGTKAKLSTVVTKYHIQTVEPDETHPDLYEKIDLYLAAKKLDGLSPRSLDNYQLELKLFSEKVKKKTQDITAADLRVYLANMGQKKNWKMTTMANKISVLKSFFGWLSAEEIIQKDPTAKLKSPKTEKRLPKALSVEDLELLREVLSDGQTTGIYRSIIRDWLPFSRGSTIE